MAIAADTDTEAHYLFTSVQQQFINLNRGLNQPFAKPVDDMSGYWTGSEKNRINNTLRYAAVGSKQTMTKKLTRFIEATQADELILSMPIHNTEARLYSLDIVSDCGLIKHVE